MRDELSAKNTEWLNPYVCFLNLSRKKQVCYFPFHIQVRIFRHLTSFCRVTLLEVLSDHLQGLSELHLGDQRIIWTNLEDKCLHFLKLT